VILNSPLTLVKTLEADPPQMFEIWRSFLIENIFRSNQKIEFIVGVL
jgi:hypothetical protein